MGSSWRLIFNNCRILFQVHVTVSANAWIDMKLYDTALYVFVCACVINIMIDICRQKSREYIGFVLYLAVPGLKNMQLS